MSAHAFLLILHIVGTVLGVGGATVSDTLFLRSVKDGHIDKKEVELIHAASHIVWLGFVIAVLSGAGLVLIGRGLMAKLLAKAVIVIIIFINGLVLHLKIFPMLERHAGEPLTSKEFVKNLPVAMTSAAVSVVSWYSALVIGAWRGLFATQWEILGAYTALLVGAIIVSNLVGRYFLQSLRRQSQTSRR